jgi:hypothetical protein
MRNRASYLVDVPVVVEPWVLPNAALGRAPDDRCDYEGSHNHPDEIRANVDRNVLTVLIAVRTRRQRQDGNRS